MIDWMQQQQQVLAPIVQHFSNRSKQKKGNHMKKTRSSNLDVRWAVKDNGLYLWQVADFLGICDGTLSRKLRKELSDDEKQKIFYAVAHLKANEGGEENG